MKITSRQARVLDNLDRIVIRMMYREPVPFLDGEDCRFQIFSLCARGLVALDANLGWIKIAEADGIVGVPCWPVRKQISEHEDLVS